MTSRCLIHLTRNILQVGYNTVFFIAVLGAAAVTAGCFLSAAAAVFGDTINGTL
jgi:hypothetical protein